MLTTLAAILTLLLSSGKAAIHPSTPQLHYTIQVDPRDTSGVHVALVIRNAPAAVTLAAHAHPEYDDKYWRHVHAMTAQQPDGAHIAVTRRDSVLWVLDNKAGDVAISWRVRFPRDEGLRAAWLPFISSEGALVGGPHSFLYVVGLEKSPARVSLDIPAHWKVGTGMAGSSNARTFTAPDMFTLMESPMLVGSMSEWNFTVHGRKHRVFYWRAPGSVSFDTIQFVRNIERLATQTVELFGAMPYDDYTFLFQDGAWGGGLEHPNSVTLGAPSADLARNPASVLPETAHEFVHTWNLMAITPSEYRKIDYRVQPPVSSLWFSEGLTLFYADLLQRRAGLPVADSTRISHLESLIERYLSAPGNARYSAEAVSRVAYNASPDALGDYTASSHLQGELIGAMLDLHIRHRSGGERSMDNVMRLMFERFRNRGFTGHDVQKAVNDVCACRTDSIFDKHVRNGNAIDFNGFLEPLGMTLKTTWEPARAPNGTPTRDLRMWGWNDSSDSTLRLRISDPASVFGEAGLRTGDRLVSINGSPVRSWPELRSFLVQFNIGDSARFVVRRGSSLVNAKVVMRQLVAPHADIEVHGGTARQVRLREEWVRGHQER